MHFSIYKIKVWIAPFCYTFFIIQFFNFILGFVIRSNNMHTRFWILRFALRHQGWFLAFLRVLDFCFSSAYSMRNPHVIGHVSSTFEFLVAIMNFTLNISLCQLVNLEHVTLNSAFVHDFGANFTSSFWWRGLLFGSLIIVRIIRWGASKNYR